MDDQLLREMYHWLFNSRKAQPARRCRYSDALIVLIYQLGVIRQRSARWACQRRNWPLWMRKLKAPSYSQLTRRLRSEPIRQLIVQMNDALRATLPCGDLKLCDGKPLTVGGFSKDPDSGEGHLPGDGWGRGYKLHVLLDANSGAIDLFCVTALGAGEPTVLRRMLRTARLDLSHQQVRGDSNYDSNPLYRVVAERGGRLLANRKKPFTGIGHRPHHPDRLGAIAELETDEQTLREHRRLRAGIERALGHLTNLPFGLSPLPNFVRRQRRVRLWVLSKVMLYHLHLSLKNSQHLPHLAA